MKKNSIKKTVLTAHIMRDRDVVKIKLALLLGETVNVDFDRNIGIKDFDLILKRIRYDGWELFIVNENGTDNYSIDPGTIDHWRAWFLEHHGTLSFEELDPY